MRPLDWSLSHSMTVNGSLLTRGDQELQAAKEFGALGNGLAVIVRQLIGYIVRLINQFSSLLNSGAVTHDGEHRRLFSDRSNQIQTE